MQFWVALQSFCHTGICRTYGLSELAQDSMCGDYPALCDAMWTAHAGAVPTELVVQATSWAASRAQQKEFRKPVRALQGVLLRSIADRFNFTGDRAAEYEACLAEPSNFTIPASNYYVPIAWVDEHFDVQDDDVDSFKSSIGMTLTLSQQIAFWLYIAAAAFILCGAAWFASARFWLWAKASSAALKEVQDGNAKALLRD